MRLQKLFITILLQLIFVPGIFAQISDVSGEYEGSATFQKSGKIDIKAEIRQKDGNFSGIIYTPLGNTPILEGNISASKIYLKVDAGGDDLFLNGKIEAGGKITGDISGGETKGTFELKRTGDVKFEINVQPVLRLSQEKWREDLHFLAEELPKRHKNAFHRISREQFEKMVAELDAEIPSLSDEKIILGMSKITTAIGDGHTGLGWEELFPRIPLRFFWFGKELHVIQAAKELSRLNGARLIKIGGVGIEKIFDESREVISSGESEQYVLNASANLFTYPVFLKNIGAAPTLDRAAYEFIDLKGRKILLEIKTVVNDSKTDWIVPYKTTPLYLQNRDEPFFYKYLPDAKTVYVNFKWYPRRPEFAKFSKELFDFIDKHEVEKLVFDLRQNGGGDFTRGRDYFIKPLKERPKFLEHGHLFAIAGRVTFSAGMSNTADFRNDLKAIIVGEPTGARPIGYQENRGFSLPNSHLNVSYSIELYKFSEADTPGILPDKMIEPDWKSYLTGRDPALEWVLAYGSTI